MLKGDTLQVNDPAEALGAEFETEAQACSLRENCLIAFREYANEVQKTCELLGDVKNSSVPLDQLLAILAQTRTENLAQEKYLFLRQQLFEPMDTMQVCSRARDSDMLRANS